MTDLRKSGPEILTEYEILDSIFEALPDTYTVSLYPVHSNMTRPEMYVTVGGECWRIEATRHLHEGETQ